MMINISVDVLAVLHVIILDKRAIMTVGMCVKPCGTLNANENTCEAMTGEKLRAGALCASASPKQNNFKL